MTLSKQWPNPSIFKPASTILKTDFRKCLKNILKMKKNNRKVICVKYILCMQDVIFMHMQDVSSTHRNIKHLFGSMDENIKYLFLCTCKAGFLTRTFLAQNLCFLTRKFLIQFFFPLCYKIPCYKISVLKNFVLKMSS